MAEEQSTTQIVKQEAMVNRHTAFDLPSSQLA